MSAVDRTVQAPQIADEQLVNTVVDPARSCGVEHYYTIPGRDPFTEIEWEIALRNHKTEAQTVTVIEPVPGDWQVVSSSHTYEKIQAHTLKYQIPVPKEGAAKLTYRVRIRY